MAKTFKPRWTTKAQVDAALAHAHQLVSRAQAKPTRRNTLTLLRKAFRLHTSVVAIEDRGAC